MEATETVRAHHQRQRLYRLGRLSTDEIGDRRSKPTDRAVPLMPEGDATLQDIDLARERIGDNRLCLHTLSDAEDLPGTGGDRQPV